MDERALTERLIAYDSSNEEGIRLAAGVGKGWLEARDVLSRQLKVRDLPVIVAEVGPESSRTSQTPPPSGRRQAHVITVVLHAHLDVVPGQPAQFEPRLDGDRLYGRGAYDMKGALAAMLLALTDLRDQSAVRVRLGVVPDEESEEEKERGSDYLVDHGFTGDFAITGEPTDLHIGVQAKGVLAMRIAVAGRAAHGATPWLGDNAVLKALDVFRTIESLPFARQSSDLFDRPSINLGRIWGGDALNKVPDACVIDVDIRYLPEQEPERIVDQVRGIPDTRIVSMFSRPPAVVDRDSVFVQALCEAAAPHHAGDVMSVGRDGASDAVSFLRAGVPAVEFGPIGGGHHGPDEWVSVASLSSYRAAIGSFIRDLPRTATEGDGDGA
jgi:succinyl-diaminopimelate desuccinylase